LDGTVTGIGVPVGSQDGLQVAAIVPVGDNTMNHSLIGNAGVTQVFQNTGTGLAQQSVLVDGTVNVTAGTATVGQ